MVLFIRGNSLGCQPPVDFGLDLHFGYADGPELTPCPSQIKGSLKYVLRDIGLLGFRLANQGKGVGGAGGYAEPTPYATVNIQNYLLIIQV